MSLLLDALKRAAEQKAAKLRRDETSGADTPDTALDTASNRASSTDDAEDSSLPHYRLEDETEFDHSELDTRLKRVRGSGGDPTETDLDVAGFAESTLLPLSERPGTGDDETLIFAEDDVAETVDDGDVSTPRPAEDETDLSMHATTAASPAGIEVEELDSKRLADDETDLSQLLAAQREADAAASVETAAGRSAEDETDLSRLIAEQEAAIRGAADADDAGRPADDETDLSRLIAEQESEFNAAGDSADAERPADDETDLSRLIAEQEAANRGAGDGTDTGRSAADETDLGQLAATGEAAADATEDGPESVSTGAEETEVRLPGMPDDVAAGNEPPGAATDASQPSLEAGEPLASELDEAELAADESAADAGGSGADDTDAEDMSLLLVEREPTQITSPRSTTEPQSPQDALRSLQAEAPSAEDLGLVETTQHRLGGGPAAAADTTQTRNRTDSTATTRSRTGDTATTGIATATATANLGGVPRPDPGATQTYAPDNYDRTLMRLPNDEASKLFAGMKSDSDMVMTPDYAKRVFRSKSSAIRLQHAKIYTGVAFAILLAIGIYGIFEYQAESENIEANLRPLKNDPMPGILPSETVKSANQPLFGEGQVNKQALEILQSAENQGEQPGGDEALATDEPQAADEPAGAEAEPTAAMAAAGTADNPPAEAVEEVTEEPAPAVEENTVPAAGDADIPQPIVLSEPPQKAPVKTANKAQITVSGTSKPASTTVTGNGSRLQIQTRERLEQKQVLLREAYAAFRSGDDTLALKKYGEVLKIDPANRNALLARAAINVHNGNSAAAIDDYQALLLENPKDSLAMASLLAVARVSPLETETRLKVMIRDEPDSPHLNFALANAYAAQHRWQEAQGHYFTALQNNPDDPNYAYNLAVSLEHISQPKAAVSYYRRALENYNKGLATFSRDAVDRRLEKLANS